MPDPFTVNERKTNQRERANGGDASPDPALAGRAPGFRGAVLSG